MGSRKSDQSQIEKTADKLEKINELLLRLGVILAEADDPTTPMGQYADHYGVEVDVEKASHAVHDAQRSLDDALWPYRQAAAPAIPCVELGGDSGEPIALVA